MTAWAVVLAAGRGERLGGVAKALLPAGDRNPWLRQGAQHRASGAEDDRSFLAAVLATARAAGVGRAVVVVGPPFGDAVAAAARALDAEVAVNADPARGMSSSVAVGFGHVLGRGEDALLWPVDHPYVDAATVRAVLAADAEVSIPRYRGRGGHPARVGASTWAALAACPPAGARVVLADPRYRRVDVEVDDPGVVRDVDTPEELRS